MYGYVFAASEAGLRHRLTHGVVVYPDEIGAGQPEEPSIIHYGLHCSVGSFHFTKCAECRLSAAECRRVPPSAAEVTLMTLMMAAAFAVGVFRYTHGNFNAVGCTGDLFGDPPKPTHLERLCSETVLTLNDAMCVYRSPSLMACPRLSMQVLTTTPRPPSPQVRQKFRQDRQGREKLEKLERRQAYLRGQVAGWASEFARVTAITNGEVSGFGDAHSDAVARVLDIYNSNERRNRSLFAYVSNDVAELTASLEAELAAEEEQCAHLEAQIAHADAMDAAATAAAMTTADSLAAFEKELDTRAKSVNALLPAVELIGRAVEVELPQHIKEKLPLGVPSVPEYLALFEDKLHTVLHAARAIVAVRAPPEPEMDENGRPKTPPPEPTPSEALVVLRGLVHRKVLASGRHNSLRNTSKSELALD